VYYTVRRDVSEILVDRYAYLLTKEDVLALFDRLIEAYGGYRRRASRACGLEHKTTYNWLETQEMRIETKRKVLSEFFNLSGEDAYEILAKKSVESSTDIIYLLLSLIFEKAVSLDAHNEEFHNLLSRFSEIKNKYEGIIRQYLEEEVGGMETSLKGKKPEEIEFPITSNLIKLSDLNELLPSMIKDVYLRPSGLTDHQLAQSWNMPEQLLKSIATGLQMIESEFKITPIEPQKFRIITPSASRAGIVMSIAAGLQMIESEFKITPIEPQKFRIITPSTSLAGTNIQDVDLNRSEIKCGWEPIV
jgi:hypothetical protein